LKWSGGGQSHLIVIITALIIKGRISIIQFAIDPDRAGQSEKQNSDDRGN
jgi:hypothetical protein